MGSGGQSLPLVEGMFCQVQIPGKTLQRVYRLPRQAVTYENNAYLANTEGRLKTVTVTVDRIEGEYAYVGRGLGPGDRVITTRLIDPLENALLEIADTAAAKENES